jgi:DNA-nicking Smr family endonuclease
MYGLMATRVKDLAQLSTLRKELELKARERAEAQAQRGAAEQQARAAANVFKDAVADVTPLVRQNRVERDRPAEQAVPRQRWEDDRQVMIDAVSDEFEIDTVLQSDGELSFRRPGVGPDVLRKLRRGEWTIQSQIDLHGCRVDEARQVLAEFLREALKTGCRCVRVVHGKGLGSEDRLPVLKGRVRTWLAQREEVIAFCQARPAEGGGGALVVLLKPGPRQ